MNDEKRERSERVNDDGDEEILQREGGGGGGSKEWRGRE